MLECMIVGDSIGVGTKMFKPECASYAVGGWNTWQWNREFIDRKQVDLTAKTMIISLGTNDHQYVKTEAELRKMRERVKASRVYWILPAIKPDIQATVKKLAQEYGDVILPIVSLQPDRIHPSWAGYRNIAEKTR